MCLYLSNTNRFGVLVPRLHGMDMERNLFQAHVHPPLLTLLPLTSSNEIISLSLSEETVSPVVTVGCYHSSEALHLRFVVTETPVQAHTTEDNGPVWEDSCVEFFVQPDSAPLYYNFEFNPLGYCLLECGTSRYDRNKAPLSVLNLILRKSSVTPSLLGLSTPVTWSLDVVIPCEAFFGHSIFALDGLRMRANFYKCGSKRPFPHYLSWSPMPPGKPDFHQPQFFGDFNTGV